MDTIHAVIFDRDNTLLRVDPARLAALHARLHALAPQVGVEDVRRLWEAWPGEWPRTAADEPRFWSSFWGAMAATHGLPAPQVEQLAGAFGRSYATMFRPYPDTEPALRALRGAGLRLAVLTNFELPSIDLTLEAAGLDPALFELLLTRSALGVAKPDPRAFAAAAAALGLRPEQCCLVDDLPEHVAAARALGMRAYQIDRAGSPGAYAQGRLASLAELVPLVAPRAG